MAKNGYLHGVTPRKEETAFDYVPDGNGRDSYIIFNYGLKRNYKDPGKEFTSWLRKEDHTPRMDARLLMSLSPQNRVDPVLFNNWPSPRAIREN